MDLADIFLRPDIAYLMLVGGFLLAMMALLTPGTGVFELAALVILLLAGWQIFNLPVNAWALILLVLSLVFFVLAVRWTRRRIFLVLSLTFLIVGSAYLFRGEGLLPGVNPVLVIVVSIISGGSMWAISVKTMEAQYSAPSHDLEVLIGSRGVARTEIHHEGTVFVNREDWSASSDEPIPPGTEVRVLKREGFILRVEPVAAMQEEAPAAAE